MVALVQTTMQAANRGGQHSTNECRRQRRARTVHAPSPRAVDQPQACSSNRSSMAAPVQTKRQDLVADRGGKHSPHECRGRDTDAPCIRHRLALSSSRKLARSTGCSWRLRCISDHRWLVVAASTLCMSVGGGERSDSPHIGEHTGKGSVLKPARW